MVINSLESAAVKADVGADDGDLTGEGLRHLAAKLRRKLHKTPPRWQVVFPLVKTDEGLSAVFVVDKSSTFFFDNLCSTNFACSFRFRPKYRQ